MRRANKRKRDGAAAGRPARRVTAGRARRERTSRVASDTVAVAGAIGDDSESDEEEGEEQPGQDSHDQAAGGEPKPRRRGRRGGRRRRGGPEDGLAGSIVDELGPTSFPEATDAVADFDGYSAEPSPPIVQPNPLHHRPSKLRITVSKRRPSHVSVQERRSGGERAARRRQPCAKR